MAKGAKQVAKESNKKSRYETEGYKRSEQRKKITRRINRLKNDVASGKISGAANVSNANNLISSLERMKQDTYINRQTGEYKYSQKRIESTIKNVSQKRAEIEFDVEQRKNIGKEDLLTFKQYKSDEMTRFRRNEIFQQKLNAASRNAEEIGIISDISKSEAKIFYAATMDAWQGKSAKYRNQYIMEYLGVQSLEEAFDIVMSSKEAQEALRRAGKELETEVEKSPDYIDYLLSAMDV